jgi:manganese transport protein
LLRYLGPGFVITIGFIDPGNWATNIAGGSEFGYSLLWVVSLSTLMLILLQHLAAKLGIVSGRSLAANVRRRFPRPLAALFGVTIMIACVATQLAEFLGGALGFQILFGIPLWLGGPLTLAIVLVLIMGRQYHSLERIIMGFLGVIAACYVVELFIVSPDWAAAAPRWVVPGVSGASILVAMAMLGAIVMPHNIYLHSDVIQSREWDADPERRSRLMHFEFIDTTLAMGMGWLVNSAMIIVAAAVFYRHDEIVKSISQASVTLEPLAGPLARLLFGIALLAAGISSSVTSSMASGNIVAGYLGKPADIHSWAYRIGLLATALLAVSIIDLGLDPFRALIVSQACLSVQLPLTIVPLLVLSRRRTVMGEHRMGTVTTTAGWLVAAVVIGLNAFLLSQIFSGS